MILKGGEPQEIVPSGMAVTMKEYYIPFMALDTHYLNHYKWRMNSSTELVC